MKDSTVQSRWALPEQCPKGIASSEPSRKSNSQARLSPPLAGDHASPYRLQPFRPSGGVFNCFRGHHHVVRSDYSPCVECDTWPPASMANIRTCYVRCAERQAPFGTERPSAGERVYDGVPQDCRRSLPSLLRRNTSFSGLRILRRCSTTVILFYCVWYLKIDSLAGCSNL
jgi:hypothetical protein